jgi:hypothetical protein
MANDLVLSHSDPGQPILAEAQNMTISCAEHVRSGVELLQAIKKTKQEINDVLKPQIESAHKAWKVALAQKNKYFEPLHKAESIIKDKISDYEIEQDRLIQAQRLKEEEKARRAEERLIKKLEKRADKIADEETRAMIEEQIEEIHVPVNYVPEPEKIKGKTAQKTVNVKIHNINKLVRHLVNNDINLEKMVTIKLGPLKSYIKLTGAKSIPGTTITQSLIQRVI